MVVEAKPVAIYFRAVQFEGLAYAGIEMMEAEYDLV